MNLFIKRFISFVNPEGLNQIDKDQFKWDIPLLAVSKIPLSTTDKQRKKYLELEEIGQITDLWWNNNKYISSSQSY